MKKAKDIINPNNLSKIVLALAAVAVVLAIIVVVFFRAPGAIPGLGRGNECKNVVMVASGDTLSKLLIEQGLTNNDVDAIARVLKSDASITTLRANNDKIEFVRDDNDAPVSKIVIIPSPWRQVELTCGDGGNWECKTVDIERDVRVVYKSGEILDGDSFYLAGMRAGIPAGILADVYDLLAFEMDFERDIRAGQKFSVLYEENFSGGQKIDNGRVLAVQFQALRGNVKMYRFRKSDGTSGYYDEDGNGAIKSLKRTPINNAKITSSFSGRRKHPVLGFQPPVQVALLRVDIIADTETL